jgi:hypothetical protein
LSAPHAKTAKKPTRVVGNYSGASPSDRISGNEKSSRPRTSASEDDLPSPPLPAHLERLAERARDYFEAASAANTRRAYASDWKQFAGWCRSQGLEALPPSPQTVGLYITACASGAAAADGQPNSVTTIERRLSALT